MRFLTVVVAFIALSSIAVNCQEQPSKNAIEFKSTQEAVAFGIKDSNDLLQKYMYELNLCIQSQAECNLEVVLTKKVKTQKKVVKEIKQEIKREIKAAKAVEKISTIKAEIKLAKKEEHRDNKKIKQMKKELRNERIKLEKIRVKEAKVILKKEKKILKQIKKDKILVKKCNTKPDSKKCKKIVKKFNKEYQKEYILKKEEKKILKQIVKTRENHVLTFRKVKSIETKKAIILNRYNVKTTAIEKKIEKLENKLKKLSDKEGTKEVKKSTLKVEKKIAQLKKKLVTVTIQKDKAIAFKSSGPGSCNVCDDGVHQILNEIHINLVFHNSATVSKRIEPQIRNPVVQKEDFTKVLIETPTSKPNICYLPITENPKYVKKQVFQIVTSTIEKPKNKVLICDMPHLKNPHNVKKPDIQKEVITANNNPESTRIPVPQRPVLSQKVKTTEYTTVRRPHVVWRNRRVQRQHVYYTNRKERRTHKVYRTKRVRRLKRWSTVRRERRAHKVYRDHNVRRLKRWSTVRNERRAHKVYRDHNVRRLKRWSTQQKVWRKHRVNRNFRVNRPQSVTSHHWVQGADRVVNENRVKPVTRYHWVHHRVLRHQAQTRHRNVVVAVPRWHHSRHLVWKHRQNCTPLHRLQAAHGRLYWERYHNCVNLPYLDWEDRRWHSYENQNQVQAYQVTVPYHVMERKWEPYTAYENVNVKRVVKGTGRWHSKVTQKDNWVNESRPVDEMRQETVTNHHQKWVDHKEKRAEIVHTNHQVKVDHQAWVNEKERRAHTVHTDHDVKVNHEKWVDEDQKKAHIVHTDHNVRVKNEVTKWVDEKVPETEYRNERVEVVRKP